jgi:hypothetical protein
MINNPQKNYKYFKISFFGNNINSKVFTIDNKVKLIFLASWFSLISIMFGWWNVKIKYPLRNIRNTLEALHHNLSGGIDYSKEMDETYYDDKTNHVWNNLLRKTRENINKEEVEIILEIQEEFENSEKELYSDENISYIFINLQKININKISREQIEDIFDALKSYKNRAIEKNFA